tara:strand:- start:2605 stop:3234 length:630 start_codon:yes stop_codon:yes gene_type:complete
MVKNNEYNFHLDISNTCTLKCGECMRQIMPGKMNKPSMGGRNLSLEEFKKIADACNWLSFNGQVSDPIFNPYFIDMLQYLKENTDPKWHPYNSIYTAATTRKRDKEWYLKAFSTFKEIKWFFGIDGLPHQSHQYRQGQDGEFLFKMMCMAAKMGVNTCWQYIIFNYNEDSIDDAKELADLFGLNLQIVKSNRWNHVPHLKPSEGNYRSD